MNQINELINNNFEIYWPVLAVLIIWSLAWKGLALWKSARQGQQWWFMVLLVVNTLGLLEIIYYYLISPTDRLSKKQ